MADRNAESVLPEPVGATTRACSPRAIVAHASVWTGVGAAKTLANHSRVAAEKSVEIVGRLLGAVGGPVDVPRALVVDATVGVRAEVVP